MGLFFNVKITGTMEEDSYIDFKPLLKFRLRKYLAKEDLGIEIGDYIEVTCKIFSTFGVAPTWGKLWGNGDLMLPGFATNINLKVYDEPPQ